MFLGDLRHAWRRMTSRPAAALLCAALLAIGIGISTAMFSVVDSLLLRPAPFRDPDRLVQQTYSSGRRALTRAWQAAGVLEAVESSAQERTIALGPDIAVPGRTESVTPGLFALLGVSPIRGRTFHAEEARGGKPDRVIISETLWRSAFGADPAILGRAIPLDGSAAVVVGVMPADFRFPDPRTLVWTPLDPAYDGPIVTMYGRMRAGVGPTELSARLTDAYREAGLKRTVQPRKVGDLGELAPFTRQAVSLLLAAALLVFLVLCANVASLLLARLSDRRRELAMCAALGASRVQLIRQSAIEHALIAVTGAAGGAGLGWMLTSIIPSIFLGRTLNIIDIDARALAMASALGGIAVLVAGLLPAWRGTTIRVASLTSRTFTGAMTTKIARMLLASQIAVALMLMIGSALLVRSFINILDADRGLNAAGVMRLLVLYPNSRTDAFGKGLPAFPKDTPEARRLRTAAVAEQLAGWPEIAAFAFSNSTLPQAETPDPVAIHPEGGTAVELPIEAYGVSPTFFDLFDIPMLRGRAFRSGGGPTEVVLSQRLASALWPNVDPIGRSFVLGPRQRSYLVVGVSGEVTVPALGQAGDFGELYHPFEPEIASIVRVSVRCRGDCPAREAFAARIQTVHPAIDVRTQGSVEDTFLTQQELPRAIAQVASVFAIVAVLTAAGGLFSVLTYAVGRRRREFGIRTALGASPRQMRWLVFRDGLGVVAAGAAIGAIGGWMSARALTSLQYGVTPTDPTTWIVVLGTIAITSLIAAWRPARQAMRIDPVRLLREE